MDIKRVIFIDKNAVTRAPMVAGIMETMAKRLGIEILIRGTQVQFPEPLNPKVESLLISNGIEMPDYASQNLEEEDIIEGTLLFVMEKSQRDFLIDRYEGANSQNTFFLSEYVGDELDMVDPYGGSMQAYGICYESMKTIIAKLVEKLEGGLQ